MFKKLTSILLVIISIVLIIMGSVEMNKSASSFYIEKEDYSANYDVRSASFGADFYTYMYDASETIVDELNDSLFMQNKINKNIIAASNNVSGEIADLEETVHAAAGLIVLAFGLAMFAFSLFNVACVFSKKCCNSAPAKETCTVAPAQETPAEDAVSAAPAEETAVEEPAVEAISAEEPVAEETPAE